MAKILIVDDEQNIRELISKYAIHSGHEVFSVENGKLAIEEVSKNIYDLVIMDIMMPELDGFSAVKEIRKFSNLPIIMLSARTEEYDKIYGFDLGIDDYVTKPFSPKELMLRVNAIINRMNRNNKNINNQIEYKTLKIDLIGHFVTIDNNRIDLTLKEYDLLVYLMRNNNIALSRKQLINSIWGDDYDEDDRTLDTHIKSLRKKLNQYANSIITIRGVGYRFEVEKD